MKTSKRKSSPRRAKSGASGEGEFYHIEIRPSTGFKTFRTQDVGKPGGLERVAGKRHDGTWDTQKWLISKRLAYVENGRLMASSDAARAMFDELGSVPVLVEGDRFQATPKRAVRRNGKRKTPQRRRHQRNVTKAEAMALHRS